MQPIVSIKNLSAIFWVHFLNRTFNTIAYKASIRYKLLLKMEEKSLLSKEGKMSFSLFFWRKKSFGDQVGKFFPVMRSPADQLLLPARIFSTFF